MPTESDEFLAEWNESAATLPPDTGGFGTVTFRGDPSKICGENSPGSPTDGSKDAAYLRSRGELSLWIEYIGLPQKQGGHERRILAVSSLLKGTAFDPALSFSQDPLTRHLMIRGL